MKRVLTIILTMALTLTLLTACVALPPQNETPQPEPPQVEPPQPESPPMPEPPMPEEPEEPELEEEMNGSGSGEYTDPRLASIYHAYRELLLEALYYIGDAYLDDSYGWVSGYYGVQHAEIIDFDNDGTPELLMIIGEGETLTILLFTYIDEPVLLLEKELWIWMDGYELYIATSVDGKSYLIEVQWGGSVDGERDASYQALMYGNFESVFNTFSWNTVDGSGMPTSRNFTVNGQSTSEEYYRNAPMEHLGIPYERLLFCTWEPIEGWQSAHVTIEELNDRIAALEM